MKPRNIFLAKLKRGATPRLAVGSATSVVTTDLMDEVGASFPEAHLDVEQMTALAMAGCSVLGFDNVMPLFSVWHEGAALGCKVDWGTRQRMPDCGTPLCANIEEQVDIPADLLSRPACRTPLESIRLLKRRLGDEAAVVGKVFGPWSLGYHVYEEFLVSTITNPDAVKRAMRRLIEVTVRFGQAQIDAGADALTLADHCTRDLCSPAAYREFLMEMHRELHERLACPIMLHICGDTSDRLADIARTGIECFHYDSKVAVDRVRALAGEAMSLMGGTSNAAIVRAGTPESIARDVSEKIAHGIDILGPECAVPLDAPWRNLKCMADEGKRASRLAADRG